MPVNQKNKQNANAAKQAEMANAPEGFEVKAFVPGEDMPEFDVEKETPGEEPEKVQKEQKEYKPSDAVVEILNKFPKDEIKKELGLDIDYLIKNVKQRGILENLAYGQFTSRPVRVFPRGPEHQKFVRNGGMYASVRIGQWTDKDGNVKWNYETHECKTVEKFVLDKDGNYEKSVNGTPKVTRVFDRNALEPGEVLAFDGKYLTPDQMDQLRLTGMVCDLITTTDAEHKPVNVMLEVNPLNNHELISKSASVIAERIGRAPEFKYKGTTYKLSSTQIDNIVKRKGAWIGERGSQIFVQYSAVQNKLVIATNFERAKREELEKTVSESRAQGEAQTQEQTQRRGSYMSR